MKKIFAISLLVCVVMLSGCTDDKDSNESGDKRGAVEVDISDFGSLNIKPCKWQ